MGSVRYLHHWREVDIARPQVFHDETCSALEKPSLKQNKNPRALHHPLTPSPLPPPRPPIRAGMPLASAQTRTTAFRKWGGSKQQIDLDFHPLQKALRRCLPKGLFSLSMFACLKLAASSRQLLCLCSLICACRTGQDRVYSIVTLPDRGNPKTR